MKVPLARALSKACGHEVTRLKRVALGGVELGTLAPGQWRIIAPGEIRDAFPGAPLRSDRKPGHGGT